MSVQFPSSLRARETVRLASAGEPSLSVRVEMPEVWDVVRFEAPETTPVRTLKRQALERLDPDAQFAEDYVMKLRGWEVLDENASIADVGALSGSTFLLTYARRRPVR